MKIAKQYFGKTSNGKNVYRYALKNANSMVARLITYGAILQSLETYDRKGKLADVVLGFDSMEGYSYNPRFYGAIVGRYANRIAKAKFTLEGMEYALSLNDKIHRCQCHGGFTGFNKVVWDAEIFGQGNDSAVKFTYLSKDGEEGFPGNLAVTVVYTLTSNNELKIRYQAETDKTTVIRVC